jgi:peptide/nickel transport system substrate-binding protein
MEGSPLTESVTVHDESTFTVRGINWSGLDWVVSILPKHLLQNLDYQKFYDWDFWLRPVGCGPYRYLRDVPQTMVELEANRDYYKDKPRIARVVLKFAGQAGLTELLSGNVDAIDLNPAQLTNIVNDPRFQTYWEPNPSRSWAIVWQNEHPLFRDREVRRALSLAINRRELLQLLNLPSQHLLVDGVYTRRQFGRGEMSEPRYDPAEARRLLDEAGWRQRSRDGTRQRDGYDFRFTALTLAETPGAETAVYVQDQLRNIGVDMNLQQFERGVLGDRITTGRFEAIVTFGCSSGSLESCLGERPGAGYQNPRFMKLLELARSTPDPEAVDQAYREMSDLLRADQPVAFLFRFATPHLVHRRVKGLSAPFRTNPLLFAEDLWLEDGNQQ